MTSVLVTGGTGQPVRRVVRARVGTDPRRSRVPIVGVDRIPTEASRPEPAAEAEVPLPGALAAALRAGADLVPCNRSGGRTERLFLDRRSPSRLQEA